MEPGGYPLSLAGSGGSSERSVPGFIFRGTGEKPRREGQARSQAGERPSILGERRRGCGEGGRVPAASAAVTVTTGVSPRVCCALISGLSDGAGPARCAWARMMVPRITTCNRLQQVGTTSVQKAHGCRRLWSHQQADAAGGGTLGLCEPDLAGALQTAPSVGPGGCQVQPHHRFRENVLAPLDAVFFP